jgi:hypothetical protein
MAKPPCVVKKREKAKFALAEEKTYQRSRIILKSRKRKSVRLQWGIPGNESPDRILLIRKKHVEKNYL